MRFETYEQSAPYATAVRRRRAIHAAVVFADPHIGHFRMIPSLSAERSQACGMGGCQCARRNPRDAPPAFIGQKAGASEPELILKCRRPFRFRRGENIEYTYEIVPTGFKDRWVRAVELLPSLRANVHHAVVYCARQIRSGWHAQGRVRSQPPL
jgi:hypothetical protein